MHNLIEAEIYCNNCGTEGVMVSMNHPDFKWVTGIPVHHCELTLIRDKSERTIKYIIYIDSKCYIIYEGCDNKLKYLEVDSRLNLEEFYGVDSVECKVSKVHKPIADIIEVSKFLYEANARYQVENGQGVVIIHLYSKKNH